MTNTTISKYTSFPIVFPPSINLKTSKSHIVQVLPKLNVIGKTISSNNIMKVDQSISLPVTLTTMNASSTQKQIGNNISKTDELQSQSPGFCSENTGTRKPPRKYLRYNRASGNIQKLKEGDEKGSLFPKIINRTRNKITKTVSLGPTKKELDMTVPSTIESDPGSYHVENEYTRFSCMSRYPMIPDRRKKGVSMMRSQRLFHLTKQLKTCHEVYNQLDKIEDRDKFLVTEILQRYIMALDLALIERYMGIALEITNKMYDTTKLMLPLYVNIFYNIDGTHAPLRIVVNGGQQNFIKSLSPVIYALNRIPQSSSTPDNNQQLHLETHLMKLQLEMLVLIIAPIESVIFRAILELIPMTALTAYRRLAGMNQSQLMNLHWENNSVMRKEYIEILEKFGLADQLGCKGSLIRSMNSTTIEENQSTRRQNTNCDSELEMSSDSSESQ